MSKKRMYQMLPNVGLHYMKGDDVPVRPGQVIESERELDKVYPNKFRLYQDPEQAPPEIRERKKSQEDQKDQTDVTDQFDGADEKGLQIYKIGRKFQVVDSDGENVSEPVSKGIAQEVVSEYGVE